MSYIFKVLVRSYTIISILFFISSCNWLLLSQTTSFRVEFYTLISQRDYLSAASMFHYPASLSPKDIEEKQIKLSKLIQLVSNELGEIHHYRDVPNECKYHITLSIMDTSKLKKEPFWAAGIFPVSFNKRGPGWLNLEFHKETWKSFSIRKITYDIVSLDDSFGRQLIEYGAIIDTTITTKEKLLNKFGKFYSKAFHLIIAYNPLDESDEELKADEIFYLEDILNNIVISKNIQEYKKKVYLIFSFGGDEAFIDIRKTTDILAEELWKEWQVYSNN